MESSAATAASSASSTLPASDTGDNRLNTSVPGVAIALILTVIKLDASKEVEYQRMWLLKATRLLQTPSANEIVFRMDYVTDITNSEVARQVAWILDGPIRASLLVRMTHRDKRVVYWRITTSPLR